MNRRELLALPITVCLAAFSNEAEARCRRRRRTALCCSTGKALLGTSAEGRLQDDVVNAYAPPNAWGDWVRTASCLGTCTVMITYEVLGSTTVYGQVRYFNKSGQQVEQGFFKTVTIRTGNYVQSIWVRFKGVPLGSAVRVIF